MELEGLGRHQKRMELDRCEEIEYEGKVRVSDVEMEMRQLFHGMKKVVPVVMVVVVGMMLVDVLRMVPLT